MKYLNPWSSTSTRLAYFDDYNRPPALEHRGVKVLSIGPSYSYIYNNICITQRAGLSDVQTGMTIIDLFLSELKGEEIDKCHGAEALHCKRMKLTYLKAVALLEHHNEK